MGGNLQMKLWADGNKWWSGHPSSTKVTMSVKSLIAYFNTSGTEDGTDKTWFEACRRAGGPSDHTICNAYAQAGRDDDITIVADASKSSNTTPGRTPLPEPPANTACDKHASGMLCSATQRSQATRLLPALWTPGRPPRSHLARQTRVLSRQCSPLLAASSNGGARPASVLGKLARAVSDYSPVKESQASWVNLPSWFSLAYAKNSTTVAYKQLGAVRRGNVRIKW